MALSTYGEIKTAVASWLVRTDLTTVIPDFVALAEADIRRDVRVQNMEQIATGTLTSETLAFPTRYLETRSLYVGTSLYEYVTPARYQDLANSQAKVFTIIGENIYVLTGTGAYELIYWQAYAAFSADADTNWLLTNHPDIYLAGACKHASSYLMDQTNEARFAGRYEAAVSRANSLDKLKSVGGQLRARAL